MNREAVVVGGGVSGACAALLLAGEGHRVRLVERRPNLLPLLAGFPWRGLSVDTGFHYSGALGHGEPLARLLTHLGVYRRITPLAMDPEGFDVVRDPSGGAFSFPVGYPVLRERLLQTFPAEKTAIDDYLDAVRAAYHSFPYLFPDAPWDASGFSPFGPWGEVSVSEFLSARTGNRKLVDLLTIHRVLYGAEPSETPFGAHASVVGSYYESAWRIAGGGKAVAAAFEAELSARGVLLSMGRTAVGIRLTPGGALAGVELDNGEILPCGTAVLSTHPSEALRLAPDGAFRPSYRKHIASLEDSSSALLLFAGLKEDEPSLARSNLYLLEEEAGAADSTKGMVYLTGLGCASKPEEVAGFMAICPAPAKATAPWRGTRRGERPPEYLEFKKAALHSLMKRLERGAPDLAAKVEHVGGATPLTLADYTGSPTGGLYGIKRRVGQLSPLPPTRLPGLCLTGQGVGVPGLMGATVSAFLTVGHIVGHETLLAKLRETA